MEKIELLAPAGSMDAFKAAIEAGADAIYVGGKMFGARSFANNFTNAELVSVINMAHLYGVKVYVTANTLIYDNEVSDFLDYIRFLHQNNVDAVIVQDLGMIDLIRKTFPNLEIHVSTQAHIHNLDGVKVMEKLGVKRVVLARETSIEEVIRIKKNSNIDLEIFTFGALCVSYSGQCLMSSLIGGRSGNRGECAGSCRLPYGLLDGDGKNVSKGEFPLSLKDLNTLSYVSDLILTGVTSLKIEGRMKSPSYVYKVVSLYRKLIDNYYSNGDMNVSCEDILELKKIFNRDFTKGFLFNESINLIGNSFRPNHMGVLVGKIVNYANHFAFIKLNRSINIGDGLRVIGNNSTLDMGILVNDFYIDNKLVKSARDGDIIKIKSNGKVEIGSDVLKTTDSLLMKDINNAIVNNSRRVLIDIKVYLKIGSPIEIRFSDSVNEVSVLGNVVIEAKNIKTTRDEIIAKITKLGNTVYSPRSVDVIMDDNIFIPMSEVNELRRKASLMLDKERLYKTQFLEEKYEIDVPDFKRERILSTMGTNNKSLDDVNIIYDNEKRDGHILKLPRVISDYDSYNKDEVLLVGEVGAFNHFKNCYTDFSLNVTNSYTVALLHNLGALRVTLSYEMDDDKIKYLVDSYVSRYKKSPNLELVTVAEMEMMVSKFNLNELYHKDLLYLVDRMGYKYKVINKDGLMYIYSNKIRNIYSTKYYDMGINCLRI